MESESAKVKTVDNKYKIYPQSIGKGSFAKVMKAQSLQYPGHIVACKIIHKAEIERKIDQDKSIVNKEHLKKYIINRIRQELKVWKSLKHPNIVEFEYFSETQNNIYLFMKFCDGKNLCQLVNNLGALQQTKALLLIRGVVRAVSYLFDKKIIHRDIKAENVLIHQGKAILADFGFAKYVQNVDSLNSGTRVGTAFYMAPQLFDEKPKYSAKCDVWSIGVLMYVLVHGCFPWPNNIDQISLKIYCRKVQINPKLNISQEFKQIIRMALMHDQKDRIGIKQLQAKVETLLLQAGIMDVQ